MKIPPHIAAAGFNKTQAHVNSSSFSAEERAQLQGAINDLGFTADLILALSTIDIPEAEINVEALPYIQNNLGITNCNTPRKNQFCDDIITRLLENKSQTYDSDYSCKAQIIDWSLQFAWDELAKHQAHSH